MIFSSTQPAPMLGNADLRYHLSRLNQNSQHICRVLYVIICFTMIQIDRYYSDDDSLTS